MYTKIYQSMFDGSLCTVGPWEALVTFQQMLVLADPHGDVDMTPEVISRRTTIPIDIIQKGLEVLEKPDPHSRTPEEDGKRIIRLSDTRPWGWRIVNYLQYRNMRSAEDRREYMKNYQREYRKHRKQNKHSVNDGKQNKPSQSQKQKQKQEKSGERAGLDGSKKGRGTAKTPSANSVEHWETEARERICDLYPKKRDYPEIMKFWNAWKPDRTEIEKIENGLKLWRDSAEWNECGGKYIPKPINFLKNKQYLEKLKIVEPRRNGFVY